MFSYLIIFNINKVHYAVFDFIEVTSMMIYNLHGHRNILPRPPRLLLKLNKCRFTHLLLSTLCNENIKDIFYRARIK